MYQELRFHSSRGPTTSPTASWRSAIVFPWSIPPTLSSQVWQGGRGHCYSRRSPHIAQTTDSWTLSLSYVSFLGCCRTWSPNPLSQSSLVIVNAYWTTACSWPYQPTFNFSMANTKFFRCLERLIFISKKSSLFISFSHITIHDIIVSSMGIIGFCPYTSSVDINLVTELWLVLFGPEGISQQLRPISYSSNTSCL